MKIRRGRRCRAAEASLRAAGIALAAMGVMLGVPVAATAGDGSLVDPRDVASRLDIKALAHTEAGALIVYTAETYAPFTDQVAAFKWGIDRDQDEAFDLVVFTEWRGGKLVGGVKDAAGRQVASATVTRPEPTVIKVSIPAELLGGAPAYRYAVNAEGDVDGDGANDPGERDLAPNSGLVQHRLGASASPAPVSAAPRVSAAAPVAAPAPRPAPAPPATRLPATGPDDRSLLPWAGAAFVAGGGLVALGAQRNRLRRQEVSGRIQ
jgi:LPXTG-motif cell wall-anchored protein